MDEGLKFRQSETIDDYVADDAWATDGGNLAGGDPAPPSGGAEGNKRSC